MVYSNKKQTKGVSQKVSNKKNNYKNRKGERVSKKRNSKKNKSKRSLRKKTGGAVFRHATRLGGLQRGIILAAGFPFLPKEPKFILDSSKQLFQHSQSADVSYEDLTNQLITQLNQQHFNDTINTLGTQFLNSIKFALTGSTNFEFNSLFDSLKRIKNYKSSSDKVEGSESIDRKWRDMQNHDAHQSIDSEWDDIKKSNEFLERAREFMRIASRQWDNQMFDECIKSYQNALNECKRAISVYSNDTHESEGLKKIILETLDELNSPQK